MTQLYKNLKKGKLSDYITPDKFRTVSARQHIEVPPGVTEIPVEFQIKKAMRDKLSFKIPWDGTIYGCARDKAEIKSKLGVDSDITKAYILDWDHDFLLMFELDNNIDYPVIFIDSNDVLELLENCWRIPEQRS